MIWLFPSRAPPDSCIIGRVLTAPNRYSGIICCVFITYKAESEGRAWASASGRSLVVWELKPRIDLMLFLKNDHPR
jgi:hypothetical protein